VTFETDDNYSIRFKMKKNSIRTALICTAPYVKRRRRVRSKMAMLVLKALNGLARPHLVDDNNLVSQLMTSCM